MNEHLALATINLFGVLPLESTKNLTFTAAVDTATLRHGFMFSDAVKHCYGDDALLAIVPAVAKIIGRNNASINSSFHKSWRKIATASDEQLVLEQIMHYITTYGFQELGCYSPDTVFIPAEALDLPSDDAMTIIVVDGLDKSALKARVMTLLGSGVALKNETVNELVTVLQYVGFNLDDVALVRNHESRIALYHILNVVPKDSSEFVRYLMHTLTGNGMVVKSSRTCAAIKVAMASNKEIIRDLFGDYEAANGLEPLAASFNRYKPIYLAMRGVDASVNNYINRISKLSKHAHTPMPKNYLNSITEMLLSGAEIDLDALKVELSKVNIYRQVRLYNALSYRLAGANSIVYRLRNGQGFATQVVKTLDRGKTEAVRDVVLQSIVSTIKPLVKGKTVHIPANVRYAFPTSEKQFMAGIPLGTVVEADRNLILGVQWTDLDKQVVDLDLSLSNITEKIGWDSGYRNISRDILFSGDMTSAPLPNGASELFYIDERVQEAIYLLNLNHYNRDHYYYGENEKDVPYKLVLGSDNIGTGFGRNYMLAADKVKFSLGDVMDVKQKTLGLVHIRGGEKRFVLENTSVAKGISMRHGEVAQQVLDSLGYTLDSRLYLNDVLVQAGAVLEDDDTLPVDLDLSPLSLAKDTILSLVNGQ